MISLLKHIQIATAKLALKNALYSVVKYIFVLP